MPDSTFNDQGAAYGSIVQSVRLDADMTVLLVNMPKDEKAYPLGK